ncbi:MAG: amidohydrolase family protein [Pseudomonadota bacterium]
MTDRLLVRGRWLVTGAAESDGTVEDGAVLVTGDVIEEVGDWPTLHAANPDARVIGSERTAVLPGLINAHHHSAGVTALQHAIPDDLLEPWILAHARMRPSDMGLNVLLSADRLLRSGVTSVVEVMSGGGPAEAFADRLGRGLAAYDKAGLRVAYAAGVSDQSHLVHGKGQDAVFLDDLPPELRDQAGVQLPGPDQLTRADYFAVMDEAWRRYKDHPRIDVWFGPPGPQWVSDPFLQEIAERAESLDVGIQTHLAESFYEKLHGPRDYGTATLSHMGELGLLGPRFSIAHGVWLSEAEIALLAETGSGISHNPGSNLRLRTGIAPLNALLASDTTVALGMDGTTINDDEDFFAEMRLALRLARTPHLGGPAPAPTRVFEMATLGGAKLLRQEGRLGRLAPGYQADLVLLDTARLTWPWIAPEADPRDLILLRAKASDVTSVLVAGELVLEDRQPTRFNTLEVGRALAESLAAEAYPSEAADMVAALTPHLEAWYQSWETPELDPYVVYNSRR